MFRLTVRSRREETAITTKRTRTKALYTIMQPCSFDVVLDTIHTPIAMFYSSHNILLCSCHIGLKLIYSHHRKNKVVFIILYGMLPYQIITHQIEWYFCHWHYTLVASVNNVAPCRLIIITWIVNKHMRDYSFRASVRCWDMLCTNHLVYANPRHTSNWKFEDHVYHWHNALSAWSWDQV